MMSSLEMLPRIGATPNCIPPRIGTLTCHSFSHGSTCGLISIQFITVSFLFLPMSDSTSPAETSLTLSFFLHCHSRSVFPRVDMSHHSAMQKILIQTCAEFDITYKVGHPLTIYKEMVHSFTTPQSLFQEISVYSGGL